MDNDTNALLKEIAALQKEQNELLKRYLWRLRFSLLTLLLITTATAVILGMYETKTNSASSAPPALVVPAPVNPYNQFGGYGLGNVPPYTGSQVQPSASSAEMAAAEKAAFEKAAAESR